MTNHLIFDDLQEILHRHLEPLPDYGVVVSEQDSIRHGRPPKERP